MERAPQPGDICAEENPLATCIMLTIRYPENDASDEKRGRIDFGFGRAGPNARHRAGRDRSGVRSDAITR